MGAIYIHGGFTYYYQTQKNTTPTGRRWCDKKYQICFWSVTLFRLTKLHKLCYNSVRGAWCVVRGAWCVARGAWRVRIAFWLMA